MHYRLLLVLAFLYSMHGAETIPPSALSSDKPVQKPETVHKPSLKNHANSFRLQGVEQIKIKADPSSHTQAVNKTQQAAKKQAPTIPKTNSNLLETADNKESDLKASGPHSQKIEDIPKAEPKKIITPFSTLTAATPMNTQHSNINTNPLNAGKTNPKSVIPGVIEAKQESSIKFLGKEQPKTSSQPLKKTEDSGTKLKPDLSKKAEPSLPTGSKIPTNTTSESNKSISTTSIPLNIIAPERIPEKKSDSTTRLEQGEIIKQTWKSSTEFSTQTASKIQPNSDKSNSTTSGTEEKQDSVKKITAQLTDQMTSIYRLLEANLLVVGFVVLALIVGLTIKNCYRNRANRPDPHEGTELVEVQSARSSVGI